MKILYLLTTNTSISFITSQATINTSSSFYNFDINAVGVVRLLFIIIFLIILGFIALFAFLTFRQIKTLNKVLRTQFSAVLTLISLLYLVLSIGTLVTALYLWIKPLF